MTKFYDELAKRLPKMSTRSHMFELIKQEMIQRGHWKAKPRGKINPLSNLKGK